MTNKSLLPPAPAGFEQIKRRWDNKEDCVTAQILPGEFYVTHENERILTVLGSCVSACIRDKVFGIGGMNHFMLPQTSEERLKEGNEAVVGNATRYGNYAMEHLINTILERGGKRKNLEAKVFGGGKIIASMTNIGLKNIDFVLDYIDTEGIDLLAQDLGDIYPRKVVYYPTTGRVRVKKLQDLHDKKIVSREIDYGKTIKDAPVEGEIDLF
ncbi:MAG: chemoreceptor glutamine deamidase CheD [Methylococcales bacterium]